MVEHKISHKLYFNTRLKITKFHREDTYPLYLQINYKRKPIFFKSYYFDLMSQEQFVLSAGGYSKYPKVADVVTVEEQAIKYIIENWEGDFSTALFKVQYDLLTQDICTILENQFVEYLFTFFHDKGLPTLADLINENHKSVSISNLLDDLRLALRAEIYRDLLQNVEGYGVPYLEVYQFMLQEKKWPFRFISYWEWQQPETKEKFSKFIKLKYPRSNFDSIFYTIENHVIRH